MIVRMLKNATWSNHNFRVLKGQRIEIEDSPVDDGKHRWLHRIIKEGGQCWVNMSFCEPISALEQLADCAN